VVRLKVWVFARVSEVVPLKYFHTEQPLVKFKVARRGDVNPKG